MKTATIRDLRTAFPKLEAWLRNGEEVEITKRGQPVARLVHASKAPPRKLVKVDYARQLRATWGDRVFSTAEVAEMRAAELDGEEG
jgi:prevent-host-death family protein